jgi:hypothetical protein
MLQRFLCYDVRKTRCKMCVIWPSLPQLLRDQHQIERRGTLRKRHKSATSVVAIMSVQIRFGCFRFSVQFSIQLPLALLSEREECVSPNLKMLPNFFNLVTILCLRKMGASERVGREIRRTGTYTDEIFVSDDPSLSRKPDCTLLTILCLRSQPIR